MPSSARSRAAVLTFTLVLLVTLLVVGSRGDGSVIPVPRATPTAPAARATATATTPPVVQTPAPPPPGALDVRAFGALPDDGRDDTDAFRAAADAAALAPGSTIAVPAGSWHIRASTSAAFGGILLPPDTALVGAGADATRLVLLAETVEAGWPNIRMILAGSGTRVAGLTLDGSRDAIDRDAATGTATILLRTLKGARGVVFEDLVLRNSYSNGREGFALSVSQAEDVVVRRVEAYANDGSGISVDGDIHGTPARDVRVRDVVVHDNRWQGISFYGAVDGLAARVTAWGNGMAGINVEWSTGVTIRDSTSEGNGRAGFSTWGISTGVRLERVTTRDNHVAEVVLETSSWPHRDPVTGVTERGIVQELTFVDCTLAPTGGRPHVELTIDARGTTAASILPRTLLLASPGADGWVFLVGGQHVARADLERHARETWGVDLETDAAEAG